MFLLIMSTTQKNTPPKTPWYENSIKKSFAIITGFLAIAAVGYGFGIWQKDIELKLKEIRWNQDCSEKVQNEINKYKEERQKYENAKVDNIEKSVLDLQNKINGRKRS